MTDVTGGGAAGASAIDTAGGADGGGGGGGAAASWRDALPETLRGEASLANFADVGALAQGYVDTKRAATARVPDFKTDDGLKAFADAVRPADAAAYDIPVVDGQSTDMADAFRGFAHQAGMPLAWAKATAEFYNGQMQAAIDKQTAAATQSVEALKTKMGAAAFDGKLNSVARMLPQLGIAKDDPLLEQLDMKMGSDKLLTMMFSLADRFGDPGAIDDATGAGATGALTPAQAQERWDALKVDREWRGKAAKEGSPENAEYKRLQGIIAAGRNAAQRRA